MGGVREDFGCELYLEVVVVCEFEEHFPVVGVLLFEVLDIKFVLPF